MPLVFAVSFALACHHAGATHPYGRVLERGGELSVHDLERTNLQVTAREVIVWGVMEVADGSRLSAAYAGVDAIARSELLKFIRVRIADVMVSVDSTDPNRRDAYEHTVEVAGGFLRHAGMTQHGWERVQRGEQRFLRVWSRLSVPRTEVEAALRTAREQSPLPLPVPTLEQPHS